MATAILKDGTLISLSQLCLLSESYYTPDGFSFVHEIECIVDIIERKGVCDQIIDDYFSVHIPVRNLGYIGSAPGATAALVSTFLLLRKLSMLDKALFQSPAWKARTPLRLLRLHLQPASIPGRAWRAHTLVFRGSFF